MFKIPKELIFEKPKMEVFLKLKFYRINLFKFSRFSGKFLMAVKDWLKFFNGWEIFKLAHLIHL